jgi:GntR family transcriptional regulator
VKAALNIVISPTSDDPIYKQIYDQISSQIIRGELPGEYCLPPIRTVARELRISVITIKRAWDELEHDGYIHTMAGKGCFVAPLPPEKLQNKRDTLATEKMLKDIEYYKTLGLSLSEVEELFKRISTRD